MLTLAALVLGLFVLSQLVATTGAGHRLIEASGLTPAEYARRGFFQLCWAVALVLGFLGLVGRLAADDVGDHRIVRALGAIVPLLTLGLVAVSLRLMALYDQAFGLTMLRLWVIGAAGWAGVVLVLAALRSLGLGRRIGGSGGWVFAGGLVAAASLLLAANVANPEAFVAHHDIALAERGVPLDPSYLRSLSDDADGAISKGASSASDPAVRAALRRIAGCTDGRRGVASLNLAAAQARAGAGSCETEVAP